MTFLIVSKRHQGAMHTERHTVETENEAEQSGLNRPVFARCGEVLTREKKKLNVYFTSR